MPCRFRFPTTIISLSLLFCAFSLTRSEPSQCQSSSKFELEKYRSSGDKKVHVPILSMAIDKCSSEVCEADTYEWILLNVAGIHSRFASSALAILEQEHGENHKHLDHPPPLSIEQAQLDIVNKYAKEAEHYYEVGFLCHGSNHEMMNEKWSVFSKNVLDRVKTIDIEVRMLRGEKKRNSELNEDHHLTVPHELEESATCPIEVLDWNSTMS